MRCLLLLPIVLSSLLSACTAPDDSTGDDTGLTSIVGVWGSTEAGASDTGFSYFIFLEDGHFLYMENDLTYPNEPHNGVEFGTYLFDAVNQKVSFTIEYDDNHGDLGSDSGVGTGTAVWDVGSANGGSALSFGNGLLILPKVDLSASPFHGVWQAGSLDNGRFEYLLLTSTGVLFYAENNPLSSFPDTENGIEFGEFAITGADLIGYTLSYDDNTNPILGNSGLTDSVGVLQQLLIAISIDHQTLTLDGNSFLRKL